MKGKYLLYVGNAYPHKNLGVLIEAFSRVSTSCQLVFVGKDDFFYQRLRENDRVKQLYDRVVFKTNVSDTQLRSLYQNAVACVFPSFMEGFTLPALEALANGCPVIVSDIPVFHEILGNAPKYFDPHDEKALVECLKNPPLRSPSFHEKAAKVVQKYSWEKMAKETLKVYMSTSAIG